MWFFFAIFYPCGYDLHLLDVEILSEPEEVPPVVINQKRVNTSIENLLDYRPITLRNEKERAVFQIQAKICQAFREFLDGQHFTEIHTPKLVAAGAEGGANIFSLSYFGEQAYLAQSPQFYKQMMVGVFERVYEIAPVFRAEKHDTARHLNEYTSVDFEMGYIENFEDIMAMDSRENPAETESFDLLFRGLEVTTGGQRIHNYREQVEKIESRGMHVEAFESYLMMHRCGMPPHGGLGLGLERFTARLLGFENVRNASLFPRDIHRLIP